MTSVIVPAHLIVPTLVACVTLVDVYGTREKTVIISSKSYLSYKRANDVHHTPGKKHAVFFMLTIPFQLGECQINEVILLLEIQMARYTT